MPFSPTKQCILFRLQKCDLHCTLAGGEILKKKKKNWTNRKRNEGGEKSMPLGGGKRYDQNNMPLQGCCVEKKMSDLDK